MAKKQQVTEQQKIMIAPPNYGMMYVKINNDGHDSMIVNKVKVMPAAGTEKEAPQTPEQKYQRSLYRMPGKKNEFGVPASGFKKAICAATKGLKGINYTRALTYIFVMEDDGGLVKIKGKPNMHEDYGRVQSGKTAVPIPLYRGEFKKWETTLRVRYDRNMFEAQSVLNLIALAGQSIGWGEKRLGKGYSHGGFGIAKGKDAIKVVEVRS